METPTGKKTLSTIIAENLIDVQNIIDRYFQKPIFLLGHSMGAGIAARYTGLFPEKIKLLVCLEGFSGLQPQEVERKRMREWLTTTSRRNERTIEQCIRTKKEYDSRGSQEQTRTDLR
jgi:pimeloyl-ACP methyl ester carboxylesterase